MKMPRNGPEAYEPLERSRYRLRQPNNDTVVVILLVVIVILMFFVVAPVLSEEVFGLASATD